MKMAQNMAPPRKMEPMARQAPDLFLELSMMVKEIDEKVRNLTLQPVTGASNVQTPNPGDEKPSSELGTTETITSGPQLSEEIQSGLAFIRYGAAVLTNKQRSLVNNIDWAKMSTREKIQRYTWATPRQRLSLRRYLERKANDRNEKQHSRRVAAQTASRTRNDARSQKELQQSGDVEVNPGPNDGDQPSTSRSSSTSPVPTSRQRRTKRAQKKYSGALSAAKEAAVAAVEEGLDKIAGGHDAIEELAREAEENVRLAALANEVELDERLTEQIRGFMPSSVQYHVADADVLLKQAYRVAKENLAPLFVPHVMCTARIVTEDDEADPESAGAKVLFPRSLRDMPPGVHPLSENLTPKNIDNGVPKHGKYTIVEYQVTRTTYGMLGKEVSSEELTFTISVQEFAFLRECRVAGRDFADTLRYVQAKRTRVLSFLQPAYRPHANTLAEDQLIAALLMVEDVGNHGAPHLWLHMAAQETCARLNADLVEGLYVRGYQMHLSDIFRDVFQEAVDRIKGGEMYSSVRDEVLARVSSANGGFTRFKDGVFRTAGDFARHCRINSSTYIKGVVPSFPEPSDAMNVLGGFFKRLNRPSPVLSERFKECLREANDDLISYALRGEYEEVYLEDIMAVIMEKAKAHTDWSPLNKDDYVQGAKDALTAAESGSDQVSRFMRLELGQFSTFIKSETYDPNTPKSCRFIVAPSHRVRGIMMAVLYPTMKRINAAFAKHNVKGLTLQQIDDTVYAMFSGITTSIANSDYSSFESCVEKLCHDLEKDAFVALTQNRLRNAVEALLNQLSQILQFNCQLGWGLLNIIRLSGTAHTSDGNYLANLRYIIAAFKFLVSDFDALDYLSRGNYVAEGDDGLYKMPTGITVKDVQRVLKQEASITLTSDDNFDAADGCFCSARLVVSVGEGGKVTVQRIADPVDLLSRVFCHLKPDRNTKKHDHGLMVAKAISTLFNYRSLPVVSEILNTVLEDEKAIDKLLESKNPEVRGFFSRMKSYRPEVADSIRAGWRQALGYVPSAAMRDAVAHVYDISVEAQHRMVQEFRQQWAAGIRAIDCPTMREYWESKNAVKQMVVEEVSSIRERSSLAASALGRAAKTVHDSVLVPKDMKEGLSFFFSILVMFCGATATVLGLLVSWWWLSFPILATLVLLVVIPAVWLILVVVFGVSFRTARWVTTAVAWSVIVFLAYYWVMMAHRRAAARRASSPSGQSADPAKPVPPAWWSKVAK